MVSTDAATVHSSVELNVVGVPGLRPPATNANDAVPEPSICCLADQVLPAAISATSVQLVPS
mgnify:CR=1 FL=1